MIYYTDAGTSHNGQKGFQKTIVVVHDGRRVLIERQIGDYSNNEGELTAIVLAIKIGAKVIHTDSQIARGWILRGWTKKHENRMRKGKLTERHKKMITRANEIFRSFNPEIIWVSRNENMAGHYIEDKYSL
jgi:ribonuclease HI